MLDFNIDMEEEVRPTRERKKHFGRYDRSTESEGQLDMMSDKFNSLVMARRSQPKLGLDPRC